ncbi:MAG: DNA polymerase IV [Caldimicrobium sp.]|nr:DNA polymerase IV [Caldimicrobium sp.]MCX7613571.1 DNA polymerase IV [Caldimicrobium sp.]MDW8182331.1 DNA polymerase IV [Caldimicrobium sp.]
MPYPLNIYGFPQAILHLDANAFFASVEQAVNPELKGKPVVVGKERGIVTAVSYEGKALGIKRGMTIVEVQKKFPKTIILESDYERYSLFSLKMFDILKKICPVVEEYSIDEAFADLQGLRGYLHLSYEEIGSKIKEDIKSTLGITVSIGISLTKVLAKIASNHRKPDGLTLISGREIHHYLKDLPVSEVWGIGPQRAALCEKLGIYSALDLASASEEFIKRHFPKPVYEIWLELRGIQVYPVVPFTKDKYKSISKALSFHPTQDIEFLLAQLSFNLERACFKARQYGLLAKGVIIFIKDEEFQTQSLEIKLSHPSAYPKEILPLLKEGMDLIYREGIKFRQVGVILTDLISESERATQLHLFRVNPSSTDKDLKSLYRAVDKINIKYGRTTLVHGVSLPVTKEKPLKKGSSLRIPFLSVRLS